MAGINVSTFRAIIPRRSATVGLFADVANSRSTIWVRAQLAIEDLGKPIYMPLCVFNTSLDGPSHCDGRLKGDPNSWGHPVEVVEGVRLSPI